MKLLLLFLLLSVSVFAEALTTSVVIPCYYGHVKCLPEVLDCCVHQTVLPDEVIIALSEVEHVPPEQLSDIEQGNWPFHLKIIKNSGRLSPGENRNIGAEHAVGDIIVFQDADDLPHLQRVEIAKHFFETYDIVHLIHCWIPQKEWFSTGVSFEEYRKEDIAFQRVKSYEEKHISRLVKRYEQANPPWYLHNGNICISRRVIEEVKYGTGFLGEDVDFNRRVCRHFQRSIVIKANLVIYRNLLSSFRE